MASEVITLELPIDLYNKLRKLADVEQTDPVELIARLVEVSTQSTSSGHQEDPVFELIGAYRSDQPEIDHIPASEDPDLYLTAFKIGKHADKLHAWEIAPARYKEGPEGRPIRLPLKPETDEAEE